MQNKKILFFLICFMFFIFISLDVNATYDFEYNGKNYSLPDLPTDSKFNSEHYSILEPTAYSGTYYLISYQNWSDDYYLGIQDWGYFAVCNSSGTFQSNCKMHIWSCPASNPTSWSYDSVKDGSYNISMTSGRFDSTQWVFSTDDLYKMTVSGSFPSKGTLDFTTILFIGKHIVQAPFIINRLETLENNTFDYIFVNPGGITASDTIDFIFLNNDYFNMPDGTSISGFSNAFHLNSSSPYYVSTSDGFYYQIPKKDLTCFVGATNYSYSITMYYGVDLTKVSFSFTLLSTSTTDSQLQDLNETNKGILSGIGDLLKALNPLDLENFFLYKAIGRLFTPADDFFNKWLSNMNGWLGDRFGLIYYPIELLIDFLNRIATIKDSGNYVLSWGNLDIFGSTLISSGSYDFNSLLSNDTFKNIHTIYLMIMDVIFYLLLVLYAKNAAAEVFGGRFDDQVIGNIRNHIENNKPNDAYHKTKIGFRKE